MAKKQPATPIAAKQRKLLHRCLVEASILSVEHGYSRALGPGAIVDIEEPVAPGLKLRDLIREEWFEAIEPPPVREKNDGFRDRS